MKMKILNKITEFIALYKYQIMLVLFILLVLYPLSLFIYVPKWDNINGYLPYRYFISDYLWNGHLPLWNPFQRFGYPGYADLQSGCWYPLVWILMLFGKYDITSLIIELLSCYIIAGLGMFKLSCFMHEDKKTAFILGLAYALSGFMMGSAQLMVFLVGVAWLPWCIWSILLFFKNYHVKYAFLTALFCALHITSASPAFTIVLGYILLGIFIYKAWKNRTSTFAIKKIILGGTVISLLLVILILPYIKSFIDFAPYFNRTDKLEYSGFLLANPTVVADYWSFMFPYTVISNSEWFKLTDLSMRNAYFGLFVFVAFIFALFRKDIPKPFKTPLLIGTVLFLILSFGDQISIYKWFYNLPGFGLFRHPSFFRIFAMFCMMLLSGFWIKTFLATEILNTIEKIILWTISIGVVILIPFAYINSNPNEIEKNWFEIVEIIEFHNTGFYSHLFINCVALTVLFFILLLLKKGTKFSIFQLIVSFVLLDLTIQSRLTAPSTIHYDINYSEFKTYFENLPIELNQQFNNTPFGKLDDTQGLKSTKGIWQNVATYNKTISCEGTNPMRFKLFDEAVKNGKIDFIKQNPLFYFPTRQLHSEDSLSSGYIWGIPKQLLFENNLTTIENSTVGYNSFIANIQNHASVSQTLILNQNHHHLWKAFYNNQEIPVFQVNEMVMGVEIPAKSGGQIEFLYSSPKLIYTFFISLLGYILVFYLLIFRYNKA